MGRVWTLLGLLAVGTAAACMANAKDEEVGGGASAATETEFDRNAVLDDKSLRDVGAMTVEDIQNFLDETPYNKGASALATYKENGKTAAEIIHAKSTEYGINPLELLVRAQMEQGLISHATATPIKFKHAFNCACPGTPLCAKYEGFENQADCAAGTLRRSMDRATTATGTVSGWAKSRSKETEDGLTVTPKNAATAALYTYTPYVGEAGGGQSNVGGVSLHHQVWGRFAEFTAYGAAAPQTPQQGEGDSGTDSGARKTDGGPSADAGNPPQEGDAGAGDAGAPKKDDGKKGSDDDEILGQGNAPPTSNGPPPGGVGGKGKAESLPMASEEELAGKKKNTESGCSTTGGNGVPRSAAIIAIAIAAVLVNARRRSSRRTG